MKKRDEVHRMAEANKAFQPLPLLKQPFPIPRGAGPSRAGLCPLTKDHHGPQNAYRALPQHRYLRAHRRRQDHDDRAHPVLHGCQPQDRRSARRRRHHGLDGAGAGARHHDHFRCHHLLLEGHGPVLPRAPHQHHRHPRPRGLHHRGGALHARAGRRLHGLLRRGRRAAAVGNRLAPGQQVQGAAPRVRQQDGPHRRQLLQGLRADEACA